MKKNTMMRLASVLLVLVLLTTCAISGTFAKYTSTANGEDKARVAYWGFGKDSAMTIDLFDAQYDSAESYTVKSQNGENVIAPGTTKSTTFTFGYINYAAKNITAPEVDYIFDIVVTTTGSDTEKLDANENFKWTLDSQTFDEFADLVAAIENLEVNTTPVDGKAANYYKAGTLPAGFGVDSEHTIGWTWTYSVDEAGDLADTAMGNDELLENVFINIAITATQQD